MIMNNRKELKKIVGLCLSYIGILLQTQAIDGWDNKSESEKETYSKKYLLEMQAERKYKLEIAENDWKKLNGETIVTYQCLPLDTENSYHYNKGLNDRHYFD